MTDALEWFQTRRAEAAATVSIAASGLAASGLDAEGAARLAALADRAAADRFSVVLVGAFSTGKTTLLNALLGGPHLPTHVNPCTAVLTEVRWASTPTVTVFDHAGAATPLDPAAFRSWFQLDAVDPGEGGDRFADVSRAELGLPAPLLARGVALVDTPGLDDDPARTARTIQALADADAVLFISAAHRCLGQLERAVLDDAIRPLGLRTLFLVVTMADLLGALTADVAQARADVLGRARRVFSPLLGDADPDARVFLVDARGAAAGDIGGASDPAARAGLQSFEDALRAFLVHDRGPTHLRQLAATVAAVREDLRRRRALALGALRADAEALAARQAALRPHLDALSATAPRVEAVLDAWLGAQEAALITALHAFTAETAAGLPDALRSAPVGPAAGLRLLSPEGRATVQAALEAHLAAWLGARDDAWRRAVEGALATGVEALRADLGEEARRLDDLASDLSGAFTGAPFPASAAPLPEDGPGHAERWVAVALGAVLLSPSTVAAGWHEGLPGVAQGALARVAARLAAVTLGLVAGPVGWLGLATAAVADALTLVFSGGRQLDRLRERLTEATRARLDAHLAAALPRLTWELRALLAPVRTAVLERVRADVRRVEGDLEVVLGERARTEAEVARIGAAWDDAIGHLDAALARLEVLSP